MEVIKRYVNTVDATFPTSIIIAVEAICASVNDEAKTMTLSNYLDVEDGEEPIYYRDIARVLDGQHRIEGLTEFSDESFDINVTVFVAIDIAVQANIFSTVNLAQTKVNRSLVYDLYALANTRSPQKTCHNIAVALNKNETSPFYRRIKRLGVATEGRFNETLTQAAIVQSLLRYISRDPMMDRDVLLRGKPLLPADANDSQKLIFRNMFVDEKDLEIAEIVWNFFDAVKNRWPEAWDHTGRGNILNKTNGFKGFMRFLRDSYLHITAPGGKVSPDQFAQIMNRIELRDGDFTIDEFKPGTGGESHLYHMLRAQSGLD